ncbi:MAG TPA: T9SS type A sorting domain-containing protein, partial [Bacteroidia bacterium]|nr:T9SS type A sorting domain-containing protein [Bacteroidia bacterium]
TVADNNKCSTFDAITISDGTGPSISVTSVTEVSCNGAASGAITVSVTGGASPYHYSWSNSATTASINGLTAGPYQITVIDVDSCTAVQTINITQPTLLTASTNITQASCGSSDGAVSVTVSGGTTPYLYAWNTGATTSGINSIGVGTYSITITDKNGCTNSMQASISNSTGPLVTLDSVVDIGCAAGTAGKIIITANGGTPPYTYLWSNGSTTANISGLAAGNYALTVTDAGGCAGTANATITQAQLSPISICMATVDPATNYNNLLWDPSGAIPRISHYNIYKETTAPGVFGKIGSAPAGTGIYVDTLSDARKRSWRYELSQVDSCGNESPLSAPFKTMHLTINLGASNSINLIWDNFQGVTFNYYIVYRDSVPGIASDSIDYVTNNGIFTYTDYPPLGKSLYYHMGIDGSAGCTPSMERGHRAEALNYNSSKSNTGNITVGGSLTGVQDISPATNLYIYPNPSRGVFNMNFHLSKQESVVVKIFNPLGQVIEEMDYGKLDGKVMKQFDLSNYGMGMYIIEVKSEDGVEYRKVTVQ